MIMKIMRSIAGAGPASVFAGALAAAAFGAAPAAAQSSRYEAHDPNQSSEDAKEEPAQAAPAPAATPTRAAPRIFRVVRPGVTRAESNVESPAPISGGGQSLSGSGISVGSKDKNPGAGTGGGGSGGGGGGGGGGAAKAEARKPEPLKPERVNAKVTVSTSLAGPWLPDGEACRAPKVYTRMSGVDKKKPPKGCASPFASNDCMDISKHRDFLPTEWFNSSTIQTVVNGADFPAGKYGLYLSYSKTDIKRVGTATLKNCAAVAGPVTCQWNCPSFVVGPCYGPGCSSSPSSCTQSNQGQQGTGGGCLWTCLCKASAAPAPPAPAPPAPAPPAPAPPAPVQPPPASSACKWKASGFTIGPCYGPSDSTCSTGNRGAQQPACGATYTCTCP